MLRDNDLPIVLLCGGQGERLRPKTNDTPKPLLPIGQKPMVRHVMDNFVAQGFRRFVLCVGYKSDAFSNRYSSRQSIETSSESLCTPITEQYPNVDVTLFDGGEEMSISDRIRRAKSHLDTDRVLVSYGDVLADVDVGKLLKRHADMESAATVTGVKPRISFGVLSTEGTFVETIEEKPLTQNWINGGYLIFESPAFDYFSEEKGFIETLNELAETRNLGVYHHDGYFTGVDTHKNLRQVREIAAENSELPWTRVEP